MPLAKYVKQTNRWDNPADSTTSYTCTAFTPENNSLLVVFFIGQSDGTSAANISETMSGGGLTWNKFAEEELENSWSLRAWGYYAEVSTGSSMTVTWDGGTRALEAPAMIVYNLTGYDTSDPIGGTYTDSSVDPGHTGSYNGTLSETPSSTSYILSCAACDDGDTVEGTGWTADYSPRVGAIGYIIDHGFQSRTNWSSTTVAWDDISSGGSGAFSWVSIGVEIKAAPLGPPLDFPSSPSDQDVFSSNANTYYIYSDDQTAWEAYHPSNKTSSIEFGIDGGGSAITVGQKGTIEIPFDFTLDGWTMIADQSGSANVDLWSREYSTTLPTQGNTMTGNIGMTISSSTANQSIVIGNWTMNKINAGNVVTYNVQSCATITRLTVNLFGIKD